MLSARDAKLPLSPPLNPLPLISVLFIHIKSPSLAVSIVQPTLHPTLNLSNGLDALEVNLHRLLGALGRARSVVLAAVGRPVLVDLVFALGAVELDGGVTRAGIVRTNILLASCHFGQWKAWVIGYDRAEVRRNSKKGRK